MPKHILGMYISVADLGISKDTQLRVLKLLKKVVERDGILTFYFAYNKMRDRWEKLTFVFSKSTRLPFSRDILCIAIFFNETRLPSPGTFIKLVYILLTFMVKWLYHGLIRVHK